MKDTRSTDYQARIIEEAADWFARLQDTPVDSREREAFAHWLSASPEHVREYLALASLHTDIRDLPSTGTLDELIEAARQADAQNVIPLRAGAVFASEPNRSTGKTPGRTAKRFAWAAMVLIALACAWWLRPDANTATYSTAIGEQRSFPLPDGTLVTLNAVSQLEVRYTKRYRDVRLVYGEALFTVAKNARRPFRVWTWDSVIQAIGTQFNVHARGLETTVTVVEGTIEIRPASGPGSIGTSLPNSGPAAVPAKAAGTTAPVVRLIEGQRARIGTETAAIKVSAADPAQDTAWRDRRLVFEARPLGEVVAEFNLYHARPIEIRDPTLNAIELSGSFNANDPQSFALFLEEAGLARAQIESDRILLFALRK